MGWGKKVFVVSSFSFEWLQLKGAGFKREKKTLDRDFQMREVEIGLGKSRSKQVA